MVFVDLEGVISESRKDPFAALAANILLCLSLDFPHELIERDLAGKIMLSLLHNDKESFLECAEVIEKRSLTDDSDQWVYNEYLAFFIVYAAQRWPEGVKPAKRIIEYRVDISKEDNRAQELGAAMQGSPNRGFVSIALGQNFTDQAIGSDVLGCYKNCCEWIERHKQLTPLDRLLIARVQNAWVERHLLDNPKENVALHEAVWAVHQSAGRHAKAEYILCFVTVVLIAAAFTFAYLFGTPTTKTLLGNLLTLGVIGPIPLMLLLWRYRKKFIERRTNMIFKHTTKQSVSTFKHL